MKSSDGKCVNVRPGLALGIIHLQAGNKHKITLNWYQSFYSCIILYILQSEPKQNVRFSKELQFDQVHLHFLLKGIYQSWIFEAEYWSFDYGYKSLEASKLRSVIFLIIFIIMFLIILTIFLNNIFSSFLAAILLQKECKNWKKDNSQKQYM